MKKFEEYVARPGNINWEKLIERQSLIYSHEKRKRDKMNITAELERMQKAALKDDSLRKRLLSTKNEQEPLCAFCNVAREEGFDISEMDLVYAGEEAYAGMRRATNGGGENSPMLEDEDDYYSMFMAAIDK